MRVVCCLSQCVHSKPSQLSGQLPNNQHLTKTASCQPASQLVSLQCVAAWLPWAPASCQPDASQFEDPSICASQLPVSSRAQAFVPASCQPVAAQEPWGHRGNFRHLQIHKIHVGIYSCRLNYLSKMKSIMSSTVWGQAHCCTGIFTKGRWS